MPSTYADWSDIGRVYVAVLAVLLIVLFLRLVAQRILRYGLGLGVNPHPLASLGIAAIIFATASRQYEGFGTDGTWRLWWMAAALTVTMVGMVMAVRWDLPGNHDATEPPPRR